MPIIIIRCDLTQAETADACDDLAEILDPGVFEVFLGLEDVKGWKIPTIEDWI